jgi:hypothetical protein
MAQQCGKFKKSVCSLYVCVYIYIYIHTYIYIYTMQLHRLLVELPFSPWFRVNSTTYFSHTGPSSGIYDDMHKLLHCILVLYSS